MKQIQSSKEKLQWIHENRATRKDHENGITNMNYYSILLSTFEKYLIWLQKKQEPPAKDQRLSHNQIALINYYNEMTITEGNAAEIANKSGWKNKTSGRKIWQRYSFYSSNANRKAIPDNPTPTTTKNKIKLFKSVLPYLNDTGKLKADAEINVLNIKLQTDQ
jgi:hypothetical protein